MGVSEKVYIAHIADCGEICHIEKFMEIVEPVIPSDKEVQCKFDELNKDMLQQ